MNDYNEGCPKTIGESWKVGNEAFIWWSLLMPEMSGKCKSNEANPTKSNHLIYIMIFFEGGGGKKNSKESLF